MIYMSVGSDDDFDSYSSPYDAGYEVGFWLYHVLDNEEGRFSYEWTEEGVHVWPYYHGKRYIRVFRGDFKGKRKRGLREFERKMFVKGMKDGVEDMIEEEGYYGESFEFLLEEDDGRFEDD